MSAELRPPALDLAGLQTVLGKAVSDEQARVVTAAMEPRVVVAGAGSGKTATMVARVVWLVAHGEVPPDGVLGLTFTTKAADELAGRVRVGLRKLASRGHLPRELADLEPTVSTYHAYAARLVRDHALRVGREPGARLVTPATSWQLAARAVAGYDGPMDAVAWTEATVVQAVLHLAGELSEHLVTPADVRAVGAALDRLAEAAPKLLADGRKVLSCHRAREQLLPLVERYTRAKAERQLLDFGDVVALAAQLARDVPAVGEAERATFPLVLLDEYQDTGAAQEVLLSSLFGGGRHAVTAVGDPCQSIYGWRGASAGTLRRFADRFGARTTEPLTLSTTYRNGGRVLVLANRASAVLRAEGVPVPALDPAPGREQAGVVRCALHADVDAEAAWVAASVEREVRALPARDDGRLWSQAAVLCRKRSLFPRLRAAFERRGIPVEVVGLGGLLDVPEVADLVATLQVLDDPTADAALLRLLTGPRWRIGPRDLVALGRHARHLVRGGAPQPDDPVEKVVLGVDEAHAGSLVDALDDLPPRGLSEEGRRRLDALRGELRALRRRVDQPLPELVADAERTLGLDVEVLARTGVADAASARADLDAFADAAADFAGDAAQDGQGEAVLSAFLAHLAAVREEENGLDLGTASGADTVTLMTVHAAKGLEWAVVAVPGLARSAVGGSAVFPARPQSSTSWTANARLLPFPLRGDRTELPPLAGLDKDALAAHLFENAERDAREERRLFYVACTRAEKVLLCSGFHWGEGRTVVGPSEFLLEVRAACEDGAGEIEHWVEAPPAENPVTAGERVVAWPSPLPPAGQAVQAAAERVRELVHDGVPDGELPLSPAAAALIASWDDDLHRLADEQRRAAARRSTSVLPASLSVSALVELQRDPDELARSLVRPLPRRPSPVARRGTAFHAWLEHDVYRAPQLLDETDLPGSADESAPAGPDLAELQEAFRRSAWWGRTPAEIEVPFETGLEGVLVRGRMDAVFADDDGGWEVVDWKTGPPASGAAGRAAAVQLAAYRLAWHRLSGAPLETVRAAFHHVRDDVTVRPADLLDEAGLRALVRGVPLEP
ncbi:MAG TPA: ATP-dependent DNA helicase [Mycobacteriales bacterium]|nr:ATP-dependent DNA helicase [Mycobacteriales bacterium]